MREVVFSMTGILNPITIKETDLLLQGGNITCGFLLNSFSHNPPPYAVARLGRMVERWQLAKSPLVIEWAFLFC